MKRIPSIRGIKGRIAAVAAATALVAVVGAPVALASSSPAFGFGDNTVVVSSSLDAGSKFSDADDATESSSLATPATRSEIVVKKKEPAVAPASSTDGSSDATVTDGGWRTGRASHYGIGDGFMGGTCADGSIVTETSMGVAMLGVPLGTKIEIAYNGKSVVATVVDRGPYHGGRVIDMQPAVARALGTVDAGVVTVQYRFL